MNPHYGLDIKSEKREMRRRKKDRQKEEDMIIKTKLEMRLRVQQQQSSHYFVRSSSVPLCTWVKSVLMTSSIVFGL